jgi:hypothetical protein
VKERLEDFIRGSEEEEVKDSASLEDLGGILNPNTGRISLASLISLS